MRSNPKTKLKQDNQRGAEVMSYLYNEFAKDNGQQTTEYEASDSEMNIPSLRDRVRFTSLENPEPDVAGSGKLRIGLGLDPDRAMTKKANIFTKPIHEVTHGYRNFVKSPLVDSAIHGLVATGLTRLAGHYFNPIEEQDILNETADIIRKEKLPLTQETVAKTKKRAEDNLKRNKWLFAGAVGLGTAAMNSAYHYVPGRPETLYKWSSEGFNKTASLDPLATSMDINQVKAAVMDSSMTDGNKFLSMSMLNTIDKPMVNSNDIIGAAINTGVSAFGSPIGQYTVAAALDAGTGYLGGKLLGISRPDRLATAVGVGSFLTRTLQPNI